MRTVLNELPEILNEEELDALLITSEENRRYLSGFTGSRAYLLLFCDRRTLFTDFRYREQAEQEARDFDVVECRDLFGAAAWQIAERGGHRIGFESQAVSYKQYTELREKIEPHDAELIPLSGTVEKLRMVKNEYEISCIEQAAAIASRAFRRLLGRLEPGMTELEVEMQLDQLMCQEGAEGFAFPPIVVSGQRGSLPHGRPTEKRLEAGELVTIDCGAVYKGYVSDMTRTVLPSGQPDKQQARVYNTVLQAQELGLEAIRAGMEAKKLDARVRDHIDGAGYGNYFGHGLGHGVGMNVHEGPSLSSRSEDTLRPGMVVTIEPGIYISGWGGVRIEDLVVVEEGGCRNLTCVGKDLLSV